jgi:hypothetical protein
MNASHDRSETTDVGVQLNHADSCLQEHRALFVVSFYAPLIYSRGKRMTNQLSTVDDGFGKDRSPASVLGLSIITLGIYYLVWYYKINDEIRKHDPTIKVTPGWAVVALFVPICNLVSGYSTAARIRQMQLDEGATQTVSPIVALLLQIFLGIGYPLYIASQLREHWHAHRLAALPASPVKPGLSASAASSLAAPSAPTLAAGILSCSSGHDVMLGQSFCGECGETMPPSAS